MAPRHSLFKTVVSAIGILLCTALSAQDNKPGLSASGFKGQIVVYADGSVLDPDKDDNFYLGFGGPSLRYTWGKQSAGLFFAPAMRLYLPEKGPQFLPVLAFGAEFSYGHYVISLAEFYRNNRWEAALGLGYRF